MKTLSMFDNLYDEPCRKVHYLAANKSTSQLRSVMRLTCLPRSVAPNMSSTMRDSSGVLLQYWNDRSSQRYTASFLVCNNRALYRYGICFDDARCDKT